ncbi:unnamed protein product [Cercopithifilaria johnstoni]|uniref:RING-type domain-containing protein n=1 Tax=Cercopithifilaria johnstoni TaxID=2874296 RepID=A0A8J2MAJ5_9BILA|nr:unnamed protein product [Cercopithifilaria johnstoni]
MAKKFDFKSVATWETGELESQPGPSGIRKRTATSFDECAKLLNMRQLMMIKNEQIDYLTIEERKVLYTACHVVPTVDPSYVYNLITNKSMSSVETIVEHLFGYGYPTIKQRVRRECMELRRKAFLCEDGQTFDFVQFLAIYPNPEIFFEEKRKTDEIYMKHAMAFLSRKFEQYDVKFIRKLFINSNKQLLPAYRILKKHAEAFAKSKNAPHFVTNAHVKVKFRRLSDSGKIPDYPDSLDELFFREAQFCLYEEEILNYKVNCAAKRKEALEHAERNSLLKECIICCEDCHLEEDMVKCSKGDHEFCKNCVKQHTEAQIGDGMNRISCMDPSCTDGHFETSSIQNIISPALFRLFILHCLRDEILTSNIGNIEFCPFCDFPASFGNSEDRTLVCLNAVCQKESCRKCQKESHIPLRCEEVQEDVDFETKKRKFIEERMSEAVIRKCPTCDKKITKETGCNKMTCPCGTFFCYVCNVALPKENPYEHFSNVRGRCRQDTSLEQLHEMAAKRAGLEALRLFNEHNPESIDVKAPNINELAGLKKKTKPATTKE